MKPVVPTPVKPRLKLKTYSHLAAAQRMPTEYEIATSRLLYHPARGFEVDLPIAAFIEKHQRGSPLAADNWEAFADPRQTTYTRYTVIMSEREAFTKQLFERMAAADYQKLLGAEAMQFFDGLVAPLRFPIHGLQMVAAYLGQLAPAGRITITCALQAADEMRRIHNLAYRMGQLKRPQAQASRRTWQESPGWQPLRRLVERLLTTWDWGEAFAALQLCVKPLFDDSVHVGLAERARSLGDYLLAEIFGSFKLDAGWQREWSAALATMLVRQRPENAQRLRGWIERWTGPTAEAVHALLHTARAATGSRELLASHQKWLCSLELGLADDFPGVGSP